jgi:hypothetical protein
VTCCSGYGRKWIIGLTFEVCKINLESFSFYRHVLCYHPLHHSSLAIFCNVSGNYE